MHSFAFGDIAERVNTVAVSAEDLLRAAAAIHHLPNDRRDWRARALCAKQLFGDASDKPLAVTARLEAMTQLVDAGHVPEPFAATRADVRILAECVFHAAAAEPLVGTPTGCAFHPERFLDRVRQHAVIETVDATAEDSAGEFGRPDASNQG